MQEESYSNYERTPENFEEIPVSSRRTGYEENCLEFFRLRKEIEDHYKAIRTKKRRLQEITSKFPSLEEAVKKSRKRALEIEEEQKSKKEKREAKVINLTELEEQKKKKKIKNAINQKKKMHRSYLKQGYTMSEQEIIEEGGIARKQYLYYKDMGEGKVSQHVMKGVEGLKLSSLLGEHDQEEQIMSTDED